MIIVMTQNHPEMVYILHALFKMVGKRWQLLKQILAKIKELTNYLEI